MKQKRAMVLISDDPTSLQRGAQAIHQRFEELLAEYNLQDEVAFSYISDVGRSNILPLVAIYPEAIIYGPVRELDVARIVEQHLSEGQIVSDLLAPKKELTGNLAWIKARQGTLPAEQRIVLKRSGLIDPDNIEDYIKLDGYQALAKALTEMTPQQVIDELLKSGLQGRGGAGFPVGRKWSFVAGVPAETKYVVCNADESEPGTFKDRVILESDPHSIVEAMILAGYGVNAHEGYIYIRGEYGLAQERFAKAIEQAHERGLLGVDIFGSGFDFELHLHSGAGAYICGEETALIESIEGKRGEPRSRPPYPTTHGLNGKPTLVNNVETLANVPPILLHGADWYRQFGTPSSPGTKVYTLMGNINRTGLVEVPMGITLRELINIYAKGMKSGSHFKLAQTGGSSGSIIPASLQDTPLDFESFKKAGVSLGSGAMLIADERTCIVDFVKVLLQFFRFESCGKCTPCRVGTQRSFETLERISQGQGKPSDLDDLSRLGVQMELLSNCGLGQTAAVPVRDMLKHFRAEVDAHINLGVCPVGVCPMSPESETLEQSAAEIQAS